MGNTKAIAEMIDRVRSGDDATMVVRERLAGRKAVREDEDDTTLKRRTERFLASERRRSKSRR